MQKLLIIFLLCVAEALTPVVWGQDEPKEIQSGIHAPVPIRMPDATMPLEAREKHLSGYCIVNLVVDHEGRPTRPQILRCTDPMFEQNSISAVMQYLFKPAIRIKDQVPVPVKLAIEIHYSFNGPHSREEPPALLNFTFSSPPNADTAGPDAQGVYSLTENLEPPKVKKFVSRGFSSAAESAPIGTACTLTLVLNAKGKPLDAEIVRCDRRVLEKPAIESLMKSKYVPAKMQGKKISVRAEVKITYEGYGLHESPSKDLSGTTKP